MLSAGIAGIAAVKILLVNIVDYTAKVFGAGFDVGNDLGAAGLGIAERIEQAGPGGQPARFGRPA